MNSGPRSSTAIAALLAILALYTVTVGIYMVPVMADTDANAYHGTAHMLLEHGCCHQQPKTDLAYIGKMWVVNDDGLVYPKYPPLYPAMIAAATWLFGPMGGMWVSPACAVLAVLGMWALCRTFLPPWASLLAAFAVATNPVLDSFAIRQHSHAPSTAFLTWAMALLLTSDRREGRSRLLLLAGSGLLVGYSTGIRYADVLFAVPALLWIAGRPRRWSGAAAWLAGIAIPGLTLAWYQWGAFGSPLRTGYSLTQEQTAFGLHHLLRHLVVHGPSLFTLSVGPLLLLSICGYVLIATRSWRQTLFYTAWLGPMGALYMAYYWGGKGHSLSYARFFMPLLPPFLLLAMLFAREALAAMPVSTSTRRWLIVALFFGQAAWGVPSSLVELEERYAVTDRVYDRVQFIRQHVPAGSVIFGGVHLLDSLDYYQEYELYWDFLLDQEALQRMMAPALRGGPDGLQSDRARLIQKVMLEPGAEAARTLLRHDIIDRALDQGRAVYLITAEYRDSFSSDFEGVYDLENVAEQAPHPARHLLFDAHTSNPVGRLTILRVVRP